MPNVTLKSVHYSERVGQPKEWTLDGLTLWPINLIVGKNASGKTRALNLIWNLARTFFPESNFRAQNCGYDLRFDNNGHPFRYILCVVDGYVKQEEVRAGTGEPQLVRGEGGEGSIWTETEGKNA